jgi:hypothetical protein
MRRMGREGRGPNDSVPGSEDHTGDEAVAGFGDGTKVMAQDAPPPSPAGSTKSGKERRATHYGGFGKTETDDPIRR